MIDPAQAVIIQHIDNQMRVIGQKTKLLLSKQGWDAEKAGKDPERFKELMVSVRIVGTGFPSMDGLCAGCFDWESVCITPQPLELVVGGVSGEQLPPIKARDEYLYVRKPANFQERYMFGNWV